LFTFKINIILALVALEDSHHSQGGYEISPLLNCLSMLLQLWSLLYWCYAIFCMLMISIIFEIFIKSL
jgi:hypothetical protein